MPKSSYHRRPDRSTTSAITPDGIVTERAVLTAPEATRELAGMKTRSRLRPGIGPV